MCNISNPLTKGVGNMPKGVFVFDFSRLRPNYFDINDCLKFGGDGNVESS